MQALYHTISAGFAAFVIAMCIISGSANTLLTKLANITSSLGVDGTIHKFHHPFFQTLGMFAGEFLCFLAFWIFFYSPSKESAPSETKNESDAVDIDSEIESDAKPREVMPVWLYLVPAFLDFVASSLINYGLVLTYSSVFQMLRGSVVLFTGLLSLVFLGKNLRLSQWIGLGVLLSGLVLVGVSSLIAGANSTQAPDPTLGLILIVVAQLVVATHMVVEEHLLGKYDLPPLLVVGWEGTYGLGIAAVFLAFFYYLPGPSVGGRLENSLDAMAQIANSPVVAGAFFSSFVTIAFFNFFGVTITKYMSATTRMMVDSIRTLVVWVFALAVGWERFQWMQPIGFVLLLAGFFVYYGVIPLPCLSSEEPPAASDEERARLTSANEKIQ